MFKLIFKLGRWRITHYLPDEIKQCVIVVAPHTSNWDFVYGMGAVKFMRLNPRFAIKKEWIKFPFKHLMKKCGALAIDRNAINYLGEKRSAVDSMTDLFSIHSTLQLIITPEGSRSKREKWKTGFYQVALRANVPLALGFMDYERRVCGIDKIIYPTGDYKNDMKMVMDFYSTIKGKNPEKFSVDLELS